LNNIKEHPQTQHPRGFQQLTNKTYPQKHQQKIKRTEKTSPKIILGHTLDYVTAKPTDENTLAARE
jgi:hypothetical protein